MHAVFTSADQFVMQETTSGNIEDAIFNLTRTDFAVDHMEEDPPEGVIGLPTGNQVIEAFNEGTGFIGLNNHGQSEGILIFSEAQGCPAVYVIGSYNNCEQFFPGVNIESSNGFDNLAANGKYSIVHSSCCFVAAFDEEDNFDCMARAFTTAIPDKGGPAFLGNTREGYFDPSTIREKMFCEKLGSFSHKNIGLVHAASQTWSVSPGAEHKVTYALNFFGDPEMEIWTAEPETLDVAFDHTAHTVTVTCDGSPVEDATVVFTYSGGQEYYNTTTNASGVATCGFEYQDVCVTKHNFFPVVKRIGGASETINSALELKWDMIIPSGHTVSLQNDLTLSSFGGRAARIIVEDGGTLNIAANTTIAGTENSFHPSELWKVPGNGIDVYGDLVFTGSPTFTSTDGWDGLNFYGSSCTCTGASFINTPIGLDEYASFTGSGLSFTDSPIDVDTSNLDLDDCGLSDSAIRCFYYAPGPFQMEQHIYITDTSISGVDYEPAIRLTNYPEFELSGNYIHGNFLGCYIEESGIGDPGLIEDNDITDNEMYGLVLYHSYADIMGQNEIEGNMRGIVVYRYSSWEMIGDNQIPTQKVRDNEYDEIAFTYDSAPTSATFHFNDISDDDESHTYPLMKCYDTPSGLISVSHNRWGEYFTPSLDLFPEGLYSYLPTWIPGDPLSEPSEAEELYIVASQYDEDESYWMAKQTYEQVIEEYPSSDYAKLSAQALLALEMELGKNYDQLQAYYQSICADSLDAQLYRVCNYLANYCNLEIEEYEDAITWFEDVIENSPALTDSVYAVIDAGFVYLLMEEKGEEGERSAFTGRYPELRPVSLSAYRSSKDELLSMLWGGEPASEQDIPAVVTVAQNYPNPFNPTTTIKFSIPTETNVKLTI